MGKLIITHLDFITHANNLRINFIPWDRCKCGLGVGASRNVFSGTYEDNGIIQEAALKSVKASLTKETKESKRCIILRDIIKKPRIMGRLKGHSRIVQLLAVSFNDHTPILILELAKSNLEDYLQNEHAEWRTKLGFMYDIALGLEVVHKVEAVHGDLKASNILVYNSENDHIIAKISDSCYSSADFSAQGHTPGFTPQQECFDPGIRDWNDKHATNIYSYRLAVYPISDNDATPFDDCSEGDIDDMKKKCTKLEITEHLPDDTSIKVKKVITAVKDVPLERFGLDEVKSILKEHLEWNQIFMKKRRLLLNLWLILDFRNILT